MECIVTNRNRVVLSLAAMLASAPLVPMHAQREQQPPVPIPQPGVPQIMTLEGAYVRAAYNNEGYVVLGYRTANASVGQEWLLLEIGATLRSGRKPYELTRDAISVETPGGQSIRMATVEDFRAANLTALKQPNSVMRDSINYFPPEASRACRIGFFSELGAPAMPWNQVELSPTRACVGQLFFKMPGGITHGQHWLNVKFAEGLLRVPFRILTKEEDKLLSKNYSSIKKQVDQAFGKK
jgi:hypothetical protein